MCVIFLAVPSAKLYIREMAGAISRVAKGSGRIPVHGALRGELQHWLFLRDWEGVVPWRQERHVQVYLASDASRYKWGGVVRNTGGNVTRTSDYWRGQDSRPIHVKEGEALLNTMLGVAETLRDARVDAYVDNKAVCAAWDGLGAKDPALNGVMKQLYDFTTGHNIDLRVYYIPSGENPADAPSRSVSLADTCLTPHTWERVERAWGPHTVDLMSLDSNVMRDGKGSPLRHFTQYPTPESAGVNCFAQDVAVEKNPYVFPPFLLIGPVLRLLEEQKVEGCTVVVPDLSPTPYWWPLLQCRSHGKMQLGSRGEKGIVLRPSVHGFTQDTRGLLWDLWAFRVGCA